MIVDSTTGTNTATRWKRKPKGLVEQPGERNPPPFWMIISAISA